MRFFKTHRIKDLVEAVRKDIRQLVNLREQVGFKLKKRFHMVWKVGMTLKFLILVH